MFKGAIVDVVELSYGGDRRLFLCTGVPVPIDEGHTGRWSVPCVCVEPEVLCGMSDAEIGEMVRAAAVFMPEVLSEVEERNRAEVAESGAHAGRRPRQIRSSNLYLLESNGLYKIGVGISVKARRKALATASGYPVEVVGSWPTVSEDEAYEIEKLWHSEFKDKRMNGEWFALAPEDVAVIVGAMDEDAMRAAAEAELEVVL